MGTERSARRRLRADATLEQRWASREAGFNHHLIKPVDPKKLLAFLAELIAPPLGTAQ